MAHILQEMIREAYAAFGRGDVDGYLSACTEEFVFNVPGHGALAGVYRGKDGVHELARRAMDVSGGSFREDVIDVLVSDNHAVVLARHRFTRDGQPKDYRTAHVYKLRERKLAECWEHPRDQAELDDAWGPGRTRP